MPDWPAADARAGGAGGNVDLDGLRKKEPLSANYPSSTRAGDPTHEASRFPNARTSSSENRIRTECWGGMGRTMEGG